MSLREKEVTITAPGRDQGKKFLLTELPAAQAEKWLYRFLLALSRSNLDMSQELRGAGWSGIAAVGLKAFSGMAWFDAEPLLDEMFTCVRVMPDERNPEVKRPVLDDDTEEVWTRIKLREEVLDLHAGFSLVGYLSSFRPAETPAPDSTKPQTL